MNNIKEKMTEYKTKSEEATSRAKQWIDDNWTTVRDWMVKLGIGLLCILAAVTSIFLLKKEVNKRSQSSVNPTAKWKVAA